MSRPRVRPRRSSFVALDIRRNSTGARPVGLGDGRSGAIPVVWTPCTFGGARPWWLCPRCDRRRAVLFVGRDGAPVCRVCRGIAYDVQRMGRVERLFARRNKILARLGSAPGPTSALLFKPFRMRWATFARLRAQAIAIEAEALRVGVALLLGGDAD